MKLDPFTCRERLGLVTSDGQVSAISGGGDGFARVNRVAWSPDGSRIAFIADEGSTSDRWLARGLWLARRDGDGVARRIAAQVQDLLYWSPDSQWILVWKNGQATPCD